MLSMMYDLVVVSSCPFDTVLLCSYSRPAVTEHTDSVFALESGDARMKLSLFCCLGIYE